MIVIEIFCLLLITILCCICTKSDLKEGMIYNNVLSGFFIISIIINIVYYGIFTNDLIDDFMINTIIVSLVSLYLFYSHSFAGGDCKMMIVIALLFPARLYWVFGGSNKTLVFIVAFAIFIGYCYLFFNSIYAVITKKVEITFEYIKKNIVQFLKSYIIAMIYLSLVSRVISIICSFGYEVNIWITRSLCLIVAWCVGRYSYFKKWFLVVPVVCIGFISLIVTKTLAISLNLENYIIVIVLLICQMTIRTTIYESIKVEQLKTGMILTAFSSILMQSSITKGLPGISTEDLKSRLTKEEVASIRLWAKATNTTYLTIVKKIPFAIFISIGVLLYCLIRGTTL